MSNLVSQVLGLKYPVIQGAMVWAASPSLVIGVSEAGGLGVLGTGNVTPDILQMQIREVKKATDKPFGANLLMIPDLLEAAEPVCIADELPVIYAGILANLDIELAKKHFSRWHEAGIKIVFKACFISDALKAQEAGADVIILKGWEGGGLVSQETTSVLIPQGADCLNVPLVASGGICDGRTMAAALTLGAQGIEMGSAFMLADECDIADACKDEIIKTGDMETVMTGFNIYNTSRQIRNKFTDDIIAFQQNNTKETVMAGFREKVAGAVKRAMCEGDVVNGSIMIGQIVPLLKQKRSSKEIIETTVFDCEKILGHTIR
jgi:Dioxygenases related to 2-nitropropane dioxygenase